MSNSLPWYKWYPRDWRNDVAAQSLGYFERGVWREILDIMHFCDERGVLAVNGVPIGDEGLAKMLGLSLEGLTRALTPLLQLGVAKRRESDGAIYSKRMVEDTAVSKSAYENGVRGGNPNISSKGVNPPVNGGLNPRVKGRVNPPVKGVVNLASVSDSGSGSGSSSGENESTLHNAAITPHNTEGSLATAQAPAPKKPKTVVSPTEGKIQHGKYVWLSQEELERFETQHGPEFIKRCIDKLDAWIETDPIPKKIKNGRNAGACFRSWVFNSVSEEYSKRSTAKQGQLGFKPHTAASTVEKNEQYLKERYGQDFVDNMFTIAGFGQEGLDIEPDGGVGVALLPERTTK